MTTKNRAYARNMQETVRRLPASSKEKDTNWLKEKWHVAPGHQSYVFLSSKARLVEGIGIIDSPSHVQEDCVESGLGTLKLFAQFTPKCPIHEVAWLELCCSLLLRYLSTAEYPMVFWEGGVARRVAVESGGRKVWASRSMANNPSGPY
eukprot:121321-Pelagomonas_calceolata.AAC.1